MGTYAIFSGKPFVVKGELQKKRKKGVLDANMELLKNCKITVDTDRKTIKVEPKQ